jgi:DNA invertase Pin-like site-specific DNA recombinase
MRIAVYKRVSTYQQTTDNQDADIELWLKSHNIDPEYVTTYSENESAWKANHQKELQRFKDDLCSGRKHFDVLVCWSLDRLTRQGIGALLTLINILKAYRCRVSSCKESWLDNEGGMNDLFYAFIAWAAKWESDRRSERAKAAIARKRVKGERVGRKPGAKDNKTRNPNGRRRAGYRERWRRNKQSTALPQSQMAE